MAQNHVLLETINLTQSASSVTFDNIPQTGYTDLKIVVSARITNASINEYVVVKLNSSTTNYYDISAFGNGASTGAAGNSNTVAGVYWLGTPAASTTANTFGNAEIYIPNYTSSNYKTMSIDAVSENNATTAYQFLVSGSLRNVSAVSSITLTPTAGSLAAYSTFSLYGIAAKNTTPVTAPFAEGGNIVANDGTYWYHAFLSSGTFTPLKALSCDALVIAGGGGGWNDLGGGGGAGGYRSGTSLSLTAQGYSVTVGAGGAATVKGSNSVFSTITSTGGGEARNSAAGGAGGSGAGGTRDSAAGGAGNTPSTSPSQGNNGGAAGGGNGWAGGAGGGAGGAGAAASSQSNGGVGGAGSNAHSTWAIATNTGVSGYYAGGGGGSSYPTATVYGTGGSGGGGNGGANNGSGGGSVPTPGVANTGSGGGGAANGPFVSTNGSGGSGIVIVRYPMV
jgi:hypothetical protein